MRFIMPAQIRYSETDRGGNLLLHKMIELFQDTTIFHSESLGYAVAEELALGRAWFLLAWNIEVMRMPSFGEHLYVVTEPYKMRGFYGYRRFFLTDAQGKQVVKADSLWIFMNIKDLTPMKIPKEVADTYIDHVEDTEIRVTRKFSEEGSWEEQENIQITKQYLDSNSHVNNANYVMWAEQYLPEGFEIHQVRIDYRQSAFLGDFLTVSTITEEEKCRIRFTNQEGKLIALIEVL